MSTPAVYRANLVHTRRQAPGRSFRNRLYLWLIDLDEPPALPRWARPLARFDPRDHLGDPDRSIRENLLEWLRARGIDLAGGRVVLLANPRVFGYTFNPLSVFWCYHPDGTLACVVAEVHNTHGELHCYLLHPDERGHAETAKRFYVSPFLPNDGEYELVLPAPDATLRVAITLRHAGEPVLGATLTGTRRPVTRAELLRIAVRQPLLPQRVAAAIRGHGVLLWLRRAPFTPHKPHTPQEGTR